MPTICAVVSAAKARERSAGVNAFPVSATAAGINSASLTPMAARSVSNITTPVEKPVATVTKLHKTKLRMISNDFENRSPSRPAIGQPTP